MVDISTKSVDAQPNEIQLFFGKVVMVLIAAFIFFFVMFFMFQAYVNSLIEITGGPVFWSKVEEGLYKFADTPDLTPEKKARMISALRKIAAKYRPIIEGAIEPAK
jgi:hypothetical protein